MPKMPLIDDIKSLFKMVQQLDNVELNRKILDVQAQALDMQTQIVSLREENRELHDKVALKARLTYKNHVYWDENQHPYCSKCWDTGQSAIHLHPAANGYLMCPSCGTPIATLSDRQ